MTNAYRWPSFVLCLWLLMPAPGIAQQPTYKPISDAERANWFVGSTIGPRSLAAGVFSAGWSTARNEPVEYGPHWEGFAKRYGMRLTGVGPGNAIETTLGKAWGEDPRYLRSDTASTMGRISHAATMTFLARRDDGGLHPAYARYTGIVGNNFMQNAWRPESQNSASDALVRTAAGFAGKFVSNVFEEFWPSIRAKFKR